MKKYLVNISISTDYEVEAKDFWDALATFEEEVTNPEEWLEEYGEFGYGVIDDYDEFE